MIDSNVRLPGFDCCATSHPFRLFQQPAKGWIAQTYEYWDEGVQPSLESERNLNDIGVRSFIPTGAPSFQ
jgi:hypothetical protein